MTLGSMLSQAEIDSFVADGYVAVRGALPGQFPLTPPLSPVELALDADS